MRTAPLRRGSLAVIIGGLALVASASTASAFSIPERRKEQKQTTPGHILTPAAANIPGIGFTYGILGSYFNIAESETDFLAFRFWGDLAGIGLGVLDVPLGTDMLTLNLFGNDFDRAGIESHRRGIDSDPDDRKIIELSSFSVLYGQLNLRLFERRWQLLYAMNQQKSKLDAIRDKDGELIAQGDGALSKSVNRSVGTFIDLADDRSDPRKGAQLEIYRYDKPSTDSKEADFYTMEYNGLGYVPIGNYSTWVFNLYRADAVVTRPGETDPDKVKENIGFNCDASTDPAAREECQRVEEEFTTEQISANRHGTGASLGGTQRLRSYVTNRYYAAHALAAGTEFRWNLTEEFTPFNIFIASGVRTGVQLAFFAEGGTVSDLVEDLTKDWRYSYGSGVRFILASGFVLRLDLASGSEGTQPTLIFQYPWSVF